MAADQQLTLTIFGREYRVACAPEERDDLIACARYVDMKMSAIRDAGKVMGADRVAVMAALQLAQELFAAKSAGGVSIGEMRRRLKQLNEVADEMLAPQEKLF
ncbi:MAG: cell division protein ZapA [Gemmatimonadota bacterium]